MKLQLHTNNMMFKDAITATAQQMGIPQIYIEKDYWITLALKAIFSSDITNEAVFKGGTALSKCYHLINRFSENIDLVVLKKPGETDGALKRKIKAITTLVGTIIPEITVEGITHKVGMLRKTAHQYIRTDSSNQYGEVREHIVIEATWLGNAEPYVIADVNSYVTDMMISTGQQDLVHEYSMESFPVRVLTKQRTLCEKIMSLVRFSQTVQPYNDLANKIRHIYDIYCLLGDTETAEFFGSGEFDKMMLSVKTDDLLSFKNNNQWLIHHPKDAIIFSHPSDTWERIKTPYQTTFKDLLMGELPAESDLITSIEKVAHRLQKLNWSII
ncbi:MAG: nucleotidyl transferase AbiEii/AbiGii toxin family protein [Chitinophagaceae bacterium]